MGAEILVVEVPAAAGKFTEIKKAAFAYCLLAS
jgi:hypothetical protein